MLDEEKIEKLLEKNLEEIQEIKKEVDYIKRYVFWSKVWSFSKIFFIVLPLIIGYIYLIPIFKNVLSQYVDLLGIQGGLKNMPANEQVPANIINNFLQK